MQQYVNEKLNIPRLLALGDLPVRKIAAESPHLNAGTYFGMVERLIEEGPRFVQALEQAIDAEAVSALARLLADIGYLSLDNQLAALVLEIQAGRRQPAQQRAAALLSSLRALLERLQSAYTVRRRSPRGESEPVYPDPTMADAMAYWDYEESHRKLRILAVDDITVVLNAVTSILSSHYEVFALTKGSQVEGFLKQNRPELFLLDIEMPDVNGYDLVSVIRSFPEHRDTPIVFLTGNATAENIKTAVALGAVDFITKPIDREVLLQKIEDKIIRRKAF